MSTDAVDFSEWWRRLGSAALVGTARRSAPAITELHLGAGHALTSRPAARPEEAALDAAAIGGSLRRAGRQPDANTALPPAAAADTRPEAPQRARQLLELLLVQPPADANTTDVMLRHWCATCHEAGHRVPSRLLPALLDRARSKELRGQVALVAGERGTWLAAQNPEWSWLAKHLRSTPASAEPAEQQIEPADVENWPLLGIEQRVAQLKILRQNDPATARDLLLSTWSSDAAKDRQALLKTFVTGLSPDDEDLLEAALDDRAASVRETAGQLLDGLPTSQRAARMAERLRPLVLETGRRHLEFRLPDDPDAAGRRDGLGKPPPGRSTRGWWLTRLVAGSPFDVWDGPPDKVVPMIQDHDVLHGLRVATKLRCAPDWARALLGQGADADLIAVLPPDEREARAQAALKHTEPKDLPAMLGAVSLPWSPHLSSAVVETLSELKPEQCGPMLDALTPLLVRGLHQDALPALQRWRARAQLLPRYDTQLGSVIQSRTLRQTISEAFQ